MPGHSYPFGNCTLAIFLENEQFGDPPAGYVWRCKVGALPEPVGFFSVVYAAKVPTTYLVQTVHERSAGYVDDVEVTTTHWRWTGTGDPDESDFATVTDRLHDFWTASAAWRTTGIAVREHRWYVADPAPGPPNPTVQVTADHIAGTSGSKPLPPQCAITVTQMTDVRRRWGRFYMGGLTVDVLGTGTGRVLNDVVDQIAVDAAAALFNSATNWRVQVFGSGSPASLPVRSVRCDDVFDVQRRRRNDLVLHRATETLDT
jgi:hypothetical protein